MILFDERRGCAKEKGIEVKSVGLVECMQLCITHPTKRLALLNSVGSEQ